jgi:hypothetical protein
LSNYSGIISPILIKQKELWRILGIIFSHYYFY